MAIPHQFSTQHSPPQTTHSSSHQFSAARVALIYLVAGLCWIGLSDLTLAVSGGLTSTGLLVAILKGSVFVALSSALVFWLCRREYLQLKRATDLLGAVVDGTTDAVFAKDINGRYLLANAAAANFIGRPVNEVLGRNDRELFKSPDAERLMENDRKIMDGGKAITLEETITVDEVTYIYQATKAPFFDATGAVTGIVGISRNITEHKQVESTLRETDQRLREAQRIARLGSWSWEPPTDRVWWSDAEYELFGIDPKLVQPSLASFLELLHPDDRAIALARVEEMKRGGDQFADDLRVIRGDGSCIWIHSQARATRDAAGNLLRVEGTDQDNTAQRLNEEAVRESELRLQTAVEVAGLGVIVVDYQHDTAELSPRAAEQFGFPAGVSLNRDQLHAHFHPADREELIKLIQQAIDPNGSGWFAIEHRVLRPDRSVRWLSVRKQVTFVEGQAHHAVIVAADVTDKRVAEAQLREQEMLVREAAELAKVGGWGFDPVTMQSDWTPAVARMYGLTPDAPPPPEKAMEFFSPEQRPALLAALAAAMQDGVPHDMELQLNAADGEVRWVRTICRPIIEDGRVVRVRGSLQDITDLKRVESELRSSEEQFRQAQKMEAIGRLAGGVAHDFNNLLTVINGYSELVLGSLPVDDPSRASLAAILDAGDRAARLTEQLLAFSRKSMIEPKLVDLNELVIESARLFRRLIGEDIALSVLTNPESVFVVLDPGQLEQVLMNLAVNARDAMPTGGRLTIETRLVELAPGTDRLHLDLPPGQYARLRVSDTGYGMSPEVREKIFEPFFTTKGLGKGTGLGLAVVHGIVQQSGGSITVDSSAGAGASFHIFLPAANNAAGDPTLKESTVAPRGHETVLVVEDEDSVRTLVRAALEGLGYTVLSAAGGDQARDLVQSHLGTVDLLVTDVIMPELSGRELAVALRMDRPELRVLYMSGYTDDALDRHGLQGTTEQFIQKPFTPLGLARRVREILDHKK